MAKNTGNSETLDEKAERMAVIRKARRKAGFAEVTVWVPNEQIRPIRDYAWDLIDKVGRVFPYRVKGAGARRQRKRQ